MNGSPPPAWVVDDTPPTALVGVDETVPPTVLLVVSWVVVVSLAVVVVAPLVDVAPEVLVAPLVVVVPLTVVVVAPLVVVAPPVVVVALGACLGHRGRQWLRQVVRRRGFFGRARPGC